MPTRTEIVAEFDKAWARDMRRPQGADGKAILAEVSAKLGVPYEEVRSAVLNDMSSIAGTG